MTMINNAGPKYSVIVPIYRDFYLIDSFCLEFQRIFSHFLPECDLQTIVELIFVSDGGGKEDEDIITQSSQQYSFVKGLILSRNFGQHIALTAGYQYSSGDYVAMLNVDQQDPIAELPKFFKHIDNNQLDIVYGLREKRADSLLTYSTSMVFNIILNKLTGCNTPLNVSTMRVMSERFVRAYNQLNESDRYLPGLEHWLGFDVGYVDTIHQERTEGTSSYNFKKRLEMAFNSIIGFSDYPLRLMAKIGFFMSSCGFFGIFIIVMLKLFSANFQAGYPSMVSIIVLLSGTIIFSVGLSSLYIGKVLREVQQRPTFIVKEKIKLT